MTMETKVSQWEDMNAFSHVPPGFRFHPTDEELVDYYLRKKIASRRIDLDVIKDVDLYKIEPWDLQELCTVGVEEQNEWYFFSHKDKKYPTGTRTNRATKAGFWKATGRDKAIYSKHCLIGMRKTLVFYQGRAPNGLKSDWIMHEYRLETNENGTPQEEGWVVCRVFRKRLAAVRKVGENESPNWYEESFMPDFDSPRAYAAASYHTHPCKQELDQLHQAMPQEPFLQLPHLESPKLPQPNPNMQASSAFPGGEQAHRSYYPQSNMNCFYNGEGGSGFNEQPMEQAGDWRVLDKFVASQLSHEETNYGGAPPFHVAYSHHMNA